jgi:hypothetical protein
VGCAYIGLGLFLWTVAAGFGYMAITESSGGGLLVAIVCVFLGGTCLAQSINPDTWEEPPQAVRQQTGRYPWDTKSPDVDDSRIYTDPAFGSRQHVEYESPSVQSARKHKNDPCWRPEDFTVPPCQNCKPKSEPKQKQTKGYTRQEWKNERKAKAQSKPEQKQKKDNFKSGAEADFESFWRKWKANDTSTIRRAAVIHFPGFTRMEPHDMEVITLVNSRCDEIERANRKGKRR